MRRLRDRLNNKKGFTLVELIVVIVIILILAAVLVPNVMRYIGQARESAFQSEAASYLTEIQGYAAEHYAKNNADVDEDDFTGGTYSLTEFGDSADAIDIAVKTAAEAYTALSSVTSDGKSIVAEVGQGAVTSFSYATTQYYVTWTQGGGWSQVSH